MNAFARGAFCTGQVLTAFQGQGLFASAASWGAHGDKGVQEVLQEEFVPRLRLRFSILAAIAFGKVQLLHCVCQPCAKGWLEIKALRQASEMRLACSHTFMVSNHATPEINFVPASLVVVNLTHHHTPCTLCMSRTRIMNESLEKLQKTVIDMMSGPIQPDACVHWHQQECTLASQQTVL